MDDYKEFCWFLFKLDGTVEQAYEGMSALEVSKKISDDPSIASSLNALIIAESDLADLYQERLQVAEFSVIYHDPAKHLWQNPYTAASADKALLIIEGNPWNYEHLPKWRVVPESMMRRSMDSAIYPGDDLEVW